MKGSKFIADYPPKFITDEQINKVKESLPSLDPDFIHEPIHEQKESKESNNMINMINIDKILEGLTELEIIKDTDINKVIFNQTLESDIKIILKIVGIEKNDDKITSVELVMIVLDGYKFLCDIHYNLYLDNSLDDKYALIETETGEKISDNIEVTKYDYNLLELGRLIHNYSLLVTNRFYVYNNDLYELSLSLP